MNTAIMADEKQIRDILRKQEEATARADAKSVIAVIDEDIVNYGLAPPLEHRGAAARDEAGLSAWFETWGGSVNVRMENPVVIVDGDLAVAFGLSVMSGGSDAEGEKHTWTRRTVVFRRDARGWRIVHEHNSYPTMMDGSFRSAIDLKP